MLLQGGYGGVELKYYNNEWRQQFQLDQGDYRTGRPPMPATYFSFTVDEEKCGRQDKVRIRFLDLPPEGWSIILWNPNIPEKDRKPSDYFVVPHEGIEQPIQLGAAVQFDFQLVDSRNPDWNVPCCSPATSKPAAQDLAKLHEAESTVATQAAATPKKVEATKSVEKTGGKTATIAAREQPTVKTVPSKTETKTELKTHKVQKGESLWTIWESLARPGSSWVEWRDATMKANGLAYAGDIVILSVGQSLALP